MPRGRIFSAIEQNLSKLFFQFYSLLSFFPFESVQLNDYQFNYVIFYIYFFNIENGALDKKKIKMVEKD